MAVESGQSEVLRREGEVVPRVPRVLSRRPAVAFAVVVLSSAAWRRSSGGNGRSRRIGAVGVGPLERRECRVSRPRRRRRKIGEFPKASSCLLRYEGPVIKGRSQQRASKSSAPNEPLSEFIQDRDALLHVAHCARGKACDRVSSRKDVDDCDTNKEAQRSYKPGKNSDGLRRTSPAVMAQSGAYQKALASCPCFRR